MLYKIALIVAFQIVSFNSFSANVLQIPLARSQFDISHDYYKTLLTMALTKAAHGREIPKLTAIYPMQQGRALKELIKGEKLDVFWLGTDKARENELRAIKVPLEMGLMGFRKFIIRKDKLALFEKVTTLKQLQKLVACQGTHWPDTQILHAADLPVLSSPVYENLFLQVNFGRCDYFPRGIHEGAAEIKQRKKIYSDLMIYNNLILHYPFTVYFFVNKNNEKLAQWIEDGLKIAIDDGSFDHHIKTHPLTAHVFPLSKWMGVPIIEIDNPELSKDTNFHDPKYWIQEKKKL
ncbi:MAG: hypothetical protein COB35_01935 [Gammaproteobacteria bacterium]|nr:MAG: hypothetical protein COB35_01935 [Gammaproteobacteria bacterium]